MDTAFLIIAVSVACTSILVWGILRLTRSPGSPVLTGLDRWPYFWMGACLAAIKYNLDRSVAWWGFGRPWYFWNYIQPHGTESIVEVPPVEWSFYYLLVASSLPFLAVGIYLTLRRLKSMGLPLSFCILFFVPVINLVFFAALCVIPRVSKNPLSGKDSFQLNGWLPKSAAGSAMASIGIVVPIGFGLAMLGVNSFQNYGWGLFVGLPFVIGLGSVLIYNARERRSYWGSIWVALLAVIILGCIFFVMAAEGAICLIMAAPIGIVLAIFGGSIGYIIVRSRYPDHGISPTITSLIFVSMPFMMGMEYQADLKPPVLSVVSSVIIDAPPERVWPNVISFPPIPPERDWILETGIAYPTSSKIDGHGVGAIRHCVFSTGEFIEPIEVWDEPRLLKFSVAKQPEPMEELSPYPRLNTPHLHGYFQSHEGQIKLTALPNGKTLLEGTTWYTNEMWPVPYWQLWSDFIIHRIHLRVLNHIKSVSESGESKFIAPK